MSFKYYDLLSTLIIGILIIVSANIVFELEFEYEEIPLLAVAYFIGYFVNAISALLEPLYYFLMRGKPSDVLLTPIKGKDYTGFGRIKYYGAKDVIKKLRDELKDPEASTGRMFYKAMINSNGDNTTRVPDFNAQYAFSRVLLTGLIIMGIIWAFKYYNAPIFWLILVLSLVLAFVRYKERGYYYAKEVLAEYIRKQYSR